MKILMDRCDRQYCQCEGKPCELLDISGLLEVQGECLRRGILRKTEVGGKTVYERHPQCLEAEIIDSPGFPGDRKEEMWTLNKLDGITLNLSRETFRSWGPSRRCLDIWGDRPIMPVNTMTLVRFMREIRMGYPQLLFRHFYEDWRHLQVHGRHGHDLILVLKLLYLETHWEELRQFFPDERCPDYRDYRRLRLMRYFFERD